jgi:hypothetical protein
LAHHGGVYILKSEFLGADGAVKQALGAVPYAEYFPAVAKNGTVDNAPDGGVQPGAVAAGGQDSDAFYCLGHGCTLIKLQKFSRVYAIKPQNRRNQPFWTDMTSDSSEQAQLRRKLAELQSEHRDLDDVIARLAERSPVDQLQIQRLKKRKLSLRDEMSRIENMLLPDIIA